MTRIGIIVAITLAFGLLVAFPLWAQQAYQEVAVPDGGTIKGVAKFQGSPPKPSMLKVTKNQDFCGQSLPSDELKVSGDGGIGYVVVSIEGITKGKKIKRETVVVNNRKCYFEPHVQAALAGSPIDVKNSDPLLHNTHAWLGKVTIFNLALPTQGQVIKKSLRPKAGLVTIKCDAHDWMSAWIMTFDHPYYAVTDAAGAFEISEVPPGKYKLTAWHELLGTQTKEVTVTARGEARADFSFAKK